jgi:hypothetical protein
MTIFENCLDMKFNTKVSTFCLIGLFFVLFASCGKPHQKQDEETMPIERHESKKNILELTKDFLYQLKKHEADTIIFYKRTCIGCCDFYTIFWLANGQKHISKFYNDADNGFNRTMTNDLKNDKIFKVLGANYLELKNTPIKENLHNRQGEIEIFTFEDHYCYSQINIYVPSDSIMSGRLNDRYFYKYADFGDKAWDKKEKRPTNDNYQANIQSKWNLLLTTIENEILEMPETGKREFENLRRKRSNYYLFNQ